MTGHTADVVASSFQRRGGAEDVAEAVPGQPAVAVVVAPVGLGEGGLEDLAVEVRGSPVLAGWRGEDQAQRVGASFLFRVGLLDAGGELGGQLVAIGRSPGIDRAKMAKVIVGAAVTGVITVLNWLS